MYFEVTENGTPFCVNVAMCFLSVLLSLPCPEYAIASGDKTYAEKALALCMTHAKASFHPGFLKTKCLPALQAQRTVFTMVAETLYRPLVFVLLFPDPTLDAQIDESLAAMRKYFIHPEFKALLEMVGKRWKVH